MRRINRLRLSKAAMKKLAREQAKANLEKAAGTLDVEYEWNRARQNQPLKEAVAVLKKMAGKRERCMYCGDSHGTDIEHFWPKGKGFYPERMFRWTNMLLGCTDCGRIKGTQFPLAAGLPLLVKPTVDDPWQFLDFDPATGNIVPRFNPATNSTNPKGEQTVAVLQLDRREALASGYQKAFARICEQIKNILPLRSPDSASLIHGLKAADEYGLLGWCFRGTGVSVFPLNNLRQQHPALWSECAQIFKYF